MHPKRLCAAALLAAVLPLSAPATPVPWPAGDAPETEVALHCAAVLTAFGRAYSFAADLLGLEGAPAPAAVPDGLVALAGGAARLDEIAEAASGWRAAWESMGRTSFYPRLARSGSPYLADEGRDLMAAVSRCVDRFDL